MKLVYEKGAASAAPFYPALTGS
ncbi:Protein of unknown function [Bacillus cereus]|nr:Protein of unknown function [Bacillus cereus]